MLQSITNLSQTIPLGEAKAGTNTAGFLNYLAILQLELNQATYPKIMEAFDFMHPWEEIIQGIDNLTELDEKLYLLVKKKNKSKLKTYENIIHEPKIQVYNGVKEEIAFWTGEIRAGHLKCWTIFVDDEGVIQIKSEVVEQYFFAALM